MKNQFVSILGVNFIYTTMQDMVHRIEQHFAQQEKAFVVTANPEIVMKTLEDQDYKKAVDQANYVTADGIGVVKASQLLGETLPERVAGYDLMHELLNVAHARKLKLYMLGAKEEVLTKACDTVKDMYPDIQLVGSHNGYFEWDDPSLKNEMADLEPDLILVALGMPRQEQWIAENMEHFKKGVFIGVGGSFDVLAGTVERAPESWQKMNAEWLYRLVKQPSRWRRMLALPHFVFKVMGQRVKGTQSQ